MDVINGLRVLVGTAQVSEGRFCSATQGIFRGGGWVRGSGRAGPGEWARRRPEGRRPGGPKTPGDAPQNRTVRIART